MKKAIKILALLLAFSMLFMCFTACGSAEKEEENTESRDSSVDNDNKLAVKRTAKTCATNIKIIKSNAANYYACYDQTPATIEDIASMMDNGCLPECPLSEDGDHTNDYEIYIQENGSALVMCKGGHSPESVGGITQEEMDNLRLTRCNANVSSLVSNVTSYCYAYGAIPTEENLISLFGDNYPECPLSDDGDKANDYSVVVDANGDVVISCEHGHSCENNVVASSSLQLNPSLVNVEACNTNVTTIKNMILHFYARYSRIPTNDELASMFEGAQLPECPSSADGDHTNDYDIVITDPYAARVTCKNGH